jgi:phage/plasmid-like protein (TIGR03299 family)
MAHNIWNDNGRDSVFTGRGTPAWHTLGQTIEGCATWREAIDLANLNWTVGKENLYTRDGVELPTYGIFRSTDHAFLGAVGERYQPIQNESAFAFVDALIGNEGAHYDSAGALGNGEVIFCSAHLPSAGFEVVPGDKHDTYLLFKTSHDGSLAAVCKLTDVRVVCQNTLNQALRNGGDAEIKIRHTKTAQERLDMALRLIASGRKTAAALAEKMRQLAEKRMTKETLADILTRLFPQSDNGELHTKTKNNIMDILNLYESNDNNAFPEIRGSAYNLLNACTEYADKYRTAKGDDMNAARASSALFGSGEKFKVNAMDYIYAAAASMPSMSARPTMFAEPPAPAEADPKTAATRSFLSSMNFSLARGLFNS